MVDPLFWLGLSLLLVAVSLTAVLVAALPAFRELARAARSAEKLFDTLNRELPPTLEAIRLTGLEITDLTDDVSEGVQSAGRVVQQVDRSLGTVRQQAQKAQRVTRSMVVGFRAAWQTLTQPIAKDYPSEYPLDQLPAHTASPLESAARESYSYVEFEETDADLYGDDSVDYSLTYPEENWPATPPSRSDTASS